MLGLTDKNVRPTGKLRPTTPQKPITAGNKARLVPVFPTSPDAPQGPKGLFRTTKTEPHTGIEGYGRHHLPVSMLDERQKNTRI